MTRFLSSRKNRTFRGRLRFQSVTSQKAENEGVQSIQNVDKWSNRIAQWSQVAMLSLVGFGYFYTVRPVYQRDLLEEQTAKLQLEQQSLQRLNEESTARLKRSEKSLSSLLEKRTDLEDQIRKLQARQARSQVELQTLKRSSAISKAELHRLTALNKTQDRQIVENQLRLFRETGSWAWTRSYLSDGHINVFVAADPDKIDKWSRESLSQPIDEIIKAIDVELSSGDYFSLPEPHSVSRSIILDFRGKILAAREHLLCPAIDRSAWAKAWKNAQRANLETGDDCVAMHVNHTAQEEGWTRSQLASWKKSAQYKSYESSYLAACKVMSNYHADRLIADAYEKYESPCRNRLFYAQDIADGSLDRVEPVGSPIPPSPELKWFSGWYNSSN